MIMPSESDHKMEELLKAYANKRREEAGARFDLHPATRKRLQAEVARRRTVRASEPFSLLDLVVRFWPRLVLAASTLAVLGIIVALVNPHPTSKTTSEFAQNSTRADGSFQDRETVIKDIKKQSEAEGRGRALALNTPATAPALNSGIEAPKGPPAVTLEPRGLAESKPGLELSPDNRDRFAFKTESGTGAPSGADKKVPGQFGFGGNNLADNSGLKPLSRSGALGSEPGARGGGSLLEGSKLSLGAPGEQAKTDPNPGIPSSLSNKKLIDATDAPLVSGIQPSLAYSSLQENLVRKPGSTVNPSGSAGLAAVPPGAPASGARLDPDAKRSEETLDRQLPTDALATAVKSKPAVLEQLDSSLQKTRPNQRARFFQSLESDKAGITQSSGAPTLLRSFDLEQNGTRISIYDADGSVYEGRLAPASEQGGSIGGGLGLPTQEVFRELKRPEKQSLPSVQLKGTASAAQTTFFQASGTNRSLKQLVVIQGSLLSATNAASTQGLSVFQESEAIPNAPAAAPTSTPPAQAPATPTLQLRTLAPDASSHPTQIGDAVAGQSLSASVVRILGRAKVGATNEVGIDALRAPR